MHALGVAPRGSWGRAACSRRAVCARAGVSMPMCAHVCQGAIAWHSALPGGAACQLLRDLTGDGQWELALSSIPTWAAGTSTQGSTHSPHGSPQGPAPHEPLGCGKNEGLDNVGGQLAKCWFLRGVRAGSRAWHCDYVPW